MTPKYAIGQKVYTVSLRVDPGPICEHCGQYMYKDDDYAGEAERTEYVVTPRTITAIVILGEKFQNAGINYSFGEYVGKHDNHPESEVFATLEEAEERGREALEKNRQELLAQIKE